jgi:hypothetical protein
MLTGAWKNFEELEDNLTVDELLGIVDAGREKENRLHKIIMASVGINIDGDQESEDDITDSTIVGEAGDLFGIGHGLGYEVEE